MNDGAPRGPKPDAGLTRNPYSVWVDKWGARRRQLIGHQWGTVGGGVLLPIKASPSSKLKRPLDEQTTNDEGLLVCLRVVVALSRLRPSQSCASYSSKCRGAVARGQFQRRD